MGSSFFFLLSSFFFLLSSFSFPTPSSFFLLLSIVFSSPTSSFLFSLSPPSPSSFSSLSSSFSFRFSRLPFLLRLRRLGMKEACGIVLVYTELHIIYPSTYNIQLVCTLCVHENTYTKKNFLSLVGYFFF